MKNVKISILTTTYLPNSEQEANPNFCLLGMKVEEKIKLQLNDVN